MVTEAPLNAKVRRRGITMGTLVGTRHQVVLLEATDSWRKDQADLPTRPEAMTRLAELGMTHGTNASTDSSTWRVK
jgi:hypothetical protein